MIHENISLVIILPLDTEMLTMSTLMRSSAMLS